jgi:hypothetical protein
MSTESKYVNYNIEKLNLTDRQVESIVSEWYTNGMFPDILQTQRGTDLEEYLSVDCKNIIEKRKLSKEIVERIVHDWYSNIAIEFFNEDDITLDVILEKKWTT